MYYAYIPFNQVVCLVCDFCQVPFCRGCIDQYPSLSHKHHAGHDRQADRLPQYHLHSSEALIRGPILNITSLMVISFIGKFAQAYNTS